MRLVLLLPKADSTTFRPVNKEALLAHIHSRLECLPQHGGVATPETGWLANPGEPVDLADYGLQDEPQVLSFFSFFLLLLGWSRCPNLAGTESTSWQMRLPNLRRKKRPRKAVLLTGCPQAEPPAGASA